MNTLGDQLKDYDLTADPIDSFLSWYRQAKLIEENPEAMTLATADREGNVAARIVLFKGLVEGQFSLYGHDCSIKGQHMAVNPQASLVFYWHNLKRQVRVNGRVLRMPQEQVEAYFQKRGLESQVASSISEQSQVISSRHELEERFHHALALAKKTSYVKRPATWTGYYLVPTQMEFFLYREYRLNDRFLFINKNMKWNIERLQP
jgi:pyridoxamine 5'-phosphate oxidase